VASADDPALETALERLLERYPLDPAWQRPQLFAETTLVAGIRVELCGLSTRRAETCATGSAAAVGEQPLARAYFELIERTSILQALLAPESCLCVRRRDRKPVGERGRACIFLPAPDANCNYARSNGVAVGLDWSSACDAARRELIERDRVLRSWYGEATPLRVDLPTQRLSGLSTEYEIEAYRFAQPAGDDATCVAAVFAFPRRDTRPIGYGFGAHEDERLSIDKAARECLQRLGFLWGEALPSSEPAFVPNAEYHQEFYLQPWTERRLRAWLAGDHVPLRCGIRQHERVCRERAYADLTPKHLKKKLCVVKALPLSEIELAFGRGHPQVEPPLPEALLVHPIA
jgi:hypothetical protein